MHEGVRGPLTPAQRRLWFLDRLSPGDPAYHICYPVRLRGYLDTDRLISALDAVVARHESLLTRFIEVDGVPVQEVLPPRPTPVERRYVPDEDAAPPGSAAAGADRKSTRLNSSHVKISYAVFCLKK